MKMFRFAVVVLIGFLASASFAQDESAPPNESLVQGQGNASGSDEMNQLSAEYLQLWAQLLLDESLLKGIEKAQALQDTFGLGSNAKGNLYVSVPMAVGHLALIFGGTKGANALIDVMTPDQTMAKDWVMESRRLKRDLTSTKKAAAPTEAYVKRAVPIPDGVKVVTEADVALAENAYYRHLSTQPRALALRRMTPGFRAVAKSAVFVATVGAFVSLTATDAVIMIGNDQVEMVKNSLSERKNRVESVLAAAGELDAPPHP